MRGQTKPICICRLLYDVHQSTRRYSLYSIALYCILSVPCWRRWMEEVQWRRGRRGSREEEGAGVLCLCGRFCLWRNSTRPLHGNRCPPPSLLICIDRNWTSGWGGGQGIPNAHPLHHHLHHLDSQTPDIRSDPQPFLQIALLNPLPPPVSTPSPFLSLLLPPYTSTSSVWPLEKLTFPTVERLEVRVHGRKGQSTNFYSAIMFPEFGRCNWMFGHSVEISD